MIRKKCIHNKRKDRCKDCGGIGICEHNKLKSNCKNCCGTSFCIHNKRKSQCKDCGGTSFCIHNKRKSCCKDCGGSSICIHNKRKDRCKDCGGIGICEHNKLKSNCKDCCGSNICEHNKHKANCKDCCGNKICEHNKNKQSCSDCHPELLCTNCNHVYVKNSKFHPLCFNCYCVLNPNAVILKRYKTKEFHIQKSLQENYRDEIEFVYDKRIDNGCSKRRPDVRIERFTHTIIIECDEHQHKNTLCEEKRMMEIFQDLGSRPVVFIRFNPDKYIINGITVKSAFDKNCKLIKSEWNKRMNMLYEYIDIFIMNIPEKEVTLKYICYDK